MGFSLPKSPLSDGIVALRLIDERDPGDRTRLARREIANRFGLSKRTVSEYLAAYRQGRSEGTAAAFAISAWRGPGLARAFRETISRLSPNQQLLICMKLLRGSSLCDIASAIELSEAAARCAFRAH